MIIGHLLQDKNAMHGTVVQTNLIKDSVWTKHVYTVYFKTMLEAQNT